MFNPTGTTMFHSTYVGGSGGVNSVTSVAVDNLEIPRFVYLAGYTTSQGFDVVNAARPTSGGWHRRVGRPDRPRPHDHPLHTPARHSQYDHRLHHLPGRQARDYRPYHRSELEGRVRYRLYHFDELSGEQGGSAEDECRRTNGRFCHHAVNESRHKILRRILHLLGWAWVGCD